MRALAETALASDTAAPEAPRRGRLFVKYVVSLVGLVAVLLIGNGALDVWFSYNEAKQTLVRIQQEKAEAAAQRIAEFVDEIERQIGWTTHAQWSAGSVDQRRFDYVRLLRQVPAITELAQLDSDGHEQLKVSRLAMDAVGSGTDYLQDPKFTQAVAHKVWFSPVYFRKESEPYMTIAVAHAGRKPGVTVADVNLKLIWDVVSAIKIGRAGYAYVVGPDGRLIAHPDISFVLRDTDLSGLPQVAAALANPAAALDPAAGVTIAPNYVGISVLTAHAAIPALTWLVFVELPASEALAPLYQLLTRSGILLGFGLLLAAVAGGLLARRMVVPIRRLQEGAERLGAGELGHRIELKTGDEIEALADRFNRMGAQLQDSYATLEAKVEARTHELAEALEYQTATSEVLRIVASSPADLQPVFDAMLKKATELCEAKFGLLWLYDGSAFTLVATRNIPAALAMAYGTGPREMGPNTTLARAARTKQLIHVTDLKGEVAYVERDPARVALVELGGAGAHLAVPLLKKGEVIGVIAIHRQEPRPFAANQLALVTTFADQAVIAIENARLLGELRTRNADLADALDRQTATSDVLKVISGSPGELKPVFDAMLENATRICRAEIGRLTLFDGEVFTTASVRGATPEYARFLEGDRNPLGSATALSRMAAERKPVHKPDLLKDPAYLARESFAVAAVEIGGARSLIAVPLLRERSLIGGLTLFRQRAEAFTDKEIALVATFADQAVIAIENARLINETRDALDRQTATADVLKVISASPGELKPVFDTMLENALRLCEAKFGSLSRFNETRSEVVAMRDVPSAFARWLQQPQPGPGGPVLERMAGAKQPVHVADLAAEQAYLDRVPARVAAVELGGVRTMLAVPMLKAGELIGAFSIYRAEVRPFSDKQIDLVTSFANQAVIAIENARLINETREALEQQTATAEVLQVINASPGDLAPVFDAMLEKAMRLCDARFGFLALYDGDAYTMAASRNVPEALDRALHGGPHRPGQHTALGRLAETKAPVHLEDVRSDIAYLERDPWRVAAVEEGGARAQVVVPLLKKGDLIGAFIIYRQEPRRFTDNQIALVGNFADQAVIAIENARLINETREALEQQTATSELLQVINSSPGDLAPVFDAMLDKATRLCEAAFGILLTYDGARFRHAAMRSVPAPYAEFMREKPPIYGPETGPARILAGERVVHVVDMMTTDVYRLGDPNRRALVDLAGARTVLLVPLLKGDVVRGIITIFRQEVRPFSDKQIALLRNFADQAVIAIENARLINETREALERQTATAEVLRVINSSPGDLAPVFDAILQKAHSLCRIAYGSLHLYDGEMFRAVAVHGYSDAFADRIRQGFSPGPNYPGRHLLEGARIAHVPDCFEVDDPVLRAATELSGIRTALFIPLRKDQTLLGQIVASRREIQLFSEKEIALLESFATQAVIAIENARLVTEQREALEQQTATTEVLQVINASPGNLAPVFEAMLEKATRVCSADAGVLATYDGEAYWPVAVRGFGGFPRNAIHPHPETGIGRLVRGEDVVHIIDSAAGEAVEAGDPGRRAIVELGGARSQLSAALRKEGALRGALTIWRREVCPFSDKQIALLQNFAAQAVIAMENARLISETREALEQQTATAEVLQVINSSPGDLAPVFDAILQKAHGLCAVAYGSLHLYDGAMFHAVAVHGISEAFADRLRQGFRPGPNHPSQPVLEGARFAHVADCAEIDDPVTRAAHELGGIRTALFIPLRKDDTLLGQIVAARREVKLFTEKEIALLESFAAQAVIAMENARLLGELRSRNTDLAESLEQQTVTGEVLKVISRSTFDLTPVFETLAQNAVKLCAAKRAIIFRFDGKVLRPAAFYNASAELREYVERNPVPPGRHSVSARAALERRTVQVPDVQADPEYTYARSDVDPIRTILAVPMLKGDELVGVITIWRLEVKPFTDKQSALVTIFADQAVIAIENARLLGELRDRSAELARSVEELTATSDVLKIISRSAVDLDTVLNTLVETAARLCDADQAYLFRPRGDQHHLVASWGLSKEMSDFFPDHPLVAGRGTGAARAALERRTVHILDVLQDPDYTYLDAQRVAGFRTVLAVPLLREDTLVGVFGLNRTRVEPYTDKQIELVSTFADQAVIAIENARLFEELRTRSAELARSVDELTATSDVLKIISRSSVELKTVLDTLVETAASLCHADQALMFRRQGDRYHKVAWRGISGEFEEWLSRNPLPVAGTGTGRAGAEGRTIHVPDVLADPEYGWQEGARIGGFRTLLAVPLVRGGALIGVFSLNRTHVDPFTDKEIELVSTFADQAVIAIENARLFEELRDRSAELARSVDELTTLREVGQAVSSTLDLATVLETIVARAVALAGAEAGAIYRYRKSDRQFRLGTVRGLGEELVAKIRSVGIREEETTALKRAINERAPVQLPDLEAAPHLPLRDLMVAAGFRAVLMVPLIGADRLFGVLSIQKKTAGEFPESTVKLMQTFATQSVLAIQNARLFREVEEQGQALALASQHKSQFLANMSHELRTPLNAVLGYAELLADGIYGELGEKARGVLERIQSNGKHLLGLINDVLDLSKIEAGQLTLAIDDYAMPAVVHSVVSATESLAKAKGLSLVTSVPRVLPLGRGDERRLTQVLLNLVGNAIKFTEKGSVGIEVALANNCFELAVKDTGPGIAKADQARIFDEFQQVDNSSTRQKGGTGLGLAISKRIVEMHGGAITVDSEPGKGSTFVVVVPVRVEPAKEVA